MKANDWAAMLNATAAEATLTSAAATLANRGNWVIPVLLSLALLASNAF